LTPAEVDDRLQRLGVVRPGVCESAVFWEATQGLDPDAQIEAIEKSIVFLGRYGRQRAEDVERWEVTRFNARCRILSEFIEAETPKITSRNENEWL
jgi:hypothetical protein